MPLSAKWLQNKRDPKEKQNLKEIIEADTLVLGRLYEIIEEFEKELDQSEFSISEYDSPAFPYLKADRIGERRGLYKIKQLLQHLKE